MKILCAKCLGHGLNIKTYIMEKHYNKKEKENRNWKHDYSK